MHESQQGGEGVSVEGVRVEDEIREVVERQALDIVLAHGLKEGKHLLYHSWAPALSRRFQLELDLCPAY